MNRPPSRGVYDIHSAPPPSNLHPPPTTAPHPQTQPPFQSHPQPSPDRPSSRRESSPPNPTPPFDHHLPPMHNLHHRASHLHLPAVATYIEHYHYYNFNGNCTVQQAPPDPQSTVTPNAGPTVRQTAHAHPRVDIPPVPPPMRDPLSSSRAPPRDNPPYSSFHHPHHGSTPAPSTLAGEAKRPRVPTTPSGYSTLPISHLPSISAGPVGSGAPGGVSRGIGVSGTPSASGGMGGGAGGGSGGTLPGPSGLGGGSGRHPFLPSTRLGKTPTSGEMRGHGEVLPRLRGAFDHGGRISLAPLQQTTTIPPMTGLPAGEEGRNGRPVKRTRLGGEGRGVGLLGGGREVERVGPGVSEDRVGGGKGYGGEARNGNSSSPSHGDYMQTGFERGAVGRGRNVDEAQSNDWEVVVEMYQTGKGTEDGVALKMITKGDGRRVADRKLLEKRRTIGKTYECLGRERFEAAIGYKWENGVRRKQKMYHVISRCRVVNAMRKAGEPIPMEHDKLTGLIDERIAEKEAQKEAGKNAMAAANAAGGNSATRGAGVGLEGTGRLMGRVAGVAREGLQGGEGSGAGGRGLVRMSGGGMSQDGMVGEEEVVGGGMRERSRFG
eukprot:GFKZ01000614.1.p1 GENE.GFKZ01000614.1~~GFKZ01000614.1.p1  ORF type:complete len:605 (+),score=93.12 GFKZ01000614.1:719-2533(+)